jgi:hypothetical protein
VLETHGRKLHSDGRDELADNGDLACLVDEGGFSDAGVADDCYWLWGWVPEMVSEESWG